jgi:predicted MFS family arabinose efflux permease
MSLRRTTFLLAAGGGISVANIYYCQPLLGDMGRGFGVGEASMGLAAAMTQAGTALGMLVFVPLGDVIERRRLASWMCLGSACAVALTSVAPTFAWLVTASFLVGVANNIPHLLLPFAAQIAPDDQRGKVVGTVVGGLLIGILVSRFFSGWLGAMLGWRWVYRIATLVMASLAVAVARLLPPSPPTLKMPFRALYASVAALGRDEAQLRAAAASGALLFGAFSAFWTTLVFFLGTPPYHYGARAAGLFGLVAAASAGIAPVVGRAVDRRPPSAGVVFGALLTLLLHRRSDRLDRRRARVERVRMDRRVPGGHSVLGSRRTRRALAPEWPVAARDAGCVRGRRAGRQWFAGTSDRARRCLRDLLDLRELDSLAAVPERNSPEQARGVRRDLDMRGQVDRDVLRVASAKIDAIGIPDRVDLRDGSRVRLAQVAGEPPAGEAARRCAVRRKPRAQRRDGRSARPVGRRIVLDAGIRSRAKRSQAANP